MTEQTKEMGNESFRFKQFSVSHDRCSMRVGTDGVLIGAWAGQSVQPKTCLDIGCGSGLIAMMLAQRFPQSMVRGIDIDLLSVEQARENVAQSPFAKQIEITLADFREPFIMGESMSLDDRQEPFIIDRCMDLVVSNPPFFEEDTPSKTAQMNRAKHTTDLSFGQLVAGVRAIMTNGGRFSVILPYSAAPRFIGIAACEGLYLTRRCDVRGSERRPYRRAMLEFSSVKSMEMSHTQLTLCMPDGSRTDEYTALTTDFYL